MIYKTSPILLLGSYNPLLIIVIICNVNLPQIKQANKLKPQTSPAVQTTGTGTCLCQPIEWPGSILTQLYKQLEHKNIPVQAQERSCATPSSSSCCCTLYIPLLFELKYTHTYKPPTIHDLTNSRTLRKSKNNE